MASAAQQVLRLAVPVALVVAGASCKGREGTAGRGESASASAAGRRGGGGMNAAQADSAMRIAMADSANWPSYGRDYTNQRFSPLAQITPANVNGLSLAWKYKTGIPHAFEASPVVVNGVMYVSTPLNHVVALDARTGQKKWEYAAQLGTTVHCCGPVNRGVAVYGNRVYMGELDGKLVALDAGDGHKLWDVQVGDPQQGYSLNGPVIAVDGKVITGVSGAEYGIRGYVAAYDAESGKQVWRFYTIPSPEEGGWWGTWATKDPFGTTVHRDRSAERADSAKYPDTWKTGGGGVWQAVAVDRDLGLVIFTVANPSPDLDGSQRPGDNLYTNSIVAIDLKNGKHKWHLQEIPHDVWDLDPASPVVLFDVKDGNGQTVKAVGQAGKTGWVYIMDRATGKPIRRSDPFVPHANIFAPPTLNGTRMLPGANGGSEWSPTAYSPQTGYMYILGMHQPMVYIVRPQPHTPPAMWLGGSFLGNGEPQYGLFSAVDMNTGKVVWQKRVPDPMIGGALATAGGVVFTGTKDKRFLAFDAKSGRQLWSYTANGGVNAPPITYAVDGKQYVAVAAGGNYQINAPRSDELLVFTVGAGGSQPASGAAAATQGRDTTRTGGR
ncbi:MAG TPA: PQQ-binding-like beta-propeller repeat protein [Gemmatimonadaceae bacterium]|nr:PQQ-binding-like beta-propeller repeat protein [Gemmatimonadaceae bacterium]